MKTGKHLEQQSRYLELTYKLKVGIYTLMILVPFHPPYSQKLNGEVLKVER